MSKRPAQGNAKIAFWGGIERNKKEPMVLVYDDGSTNPDKQKPIWRKKMTPADVLAMHRKGAMQPLHAHAMCPHSKAVAIEVIEGLAEGKAASDVIRLDSGHKQTGQSRTIDVTKCKSFPWGEDKDEPIYRNKPTNIDIKWADGDLDYASADITIEDRTITVCVSGTGELSLTSQGQPISKHELFSGEDELVVWAEWWIFRSSRMSFLSYSQQLHNLCINPIINHRAMEARVDIAFQNAKNGRFRENAAPVQKAAMQDDKVVSSNNESRETELMDVPEMIDA